MPRGTTPSNLKLMEELHTIKANDANNDTMFQLEYARSILEHLSKHQRIIYFFIIYRIMLRYFGLGRVHCVKSDMFHIFYAFL